MERLRFLRGELEANSSLMNAKELSLVSTQYATTIGLVVCFLKKYSDKS